MPSARDQEAAGARQEEGLDAWPRSEIYRLMVESVRDYAIFALDRNGHILTWNAGAERLKGYRAEEARGRHFSIFYTDEDIARGKPSHGLRAATQFGRFEDEGWRLRRDRTRFWANVTITPIHDPTTRELLGFSKVTRDLTERRQAEEALRASEERFRLLVEGVTDYAIYLLDPQGHVQSWNKGAERLKGYRPSEIVGQHYRVFFPPDDASGGRPERELELATRDGHYAEEGWRVRKDGTRFWASIVLTALRDPRDGHLIGFSKVTRDLTARRRAEERLQRAYRDMEAFGYTVSHDLRAPLRAILTLADYTLRDHGPALPPEGRANLEAMKQSAEAAAQLIEDLLRFSRATAAEARSEHVDITRLANEAATSLRSQYAHEVGLAVDDDLVAVGDPELLRIAMNNLLSNAWKYTQKAKAARVSVGALRTDEDGRRIFYVRDNGVGFEAKRAGELFQPFRRLHANEFSGSGIGLATVRRIVERLGGSVWAEGRPGEGATFYFSLPAERAA